jgi:tetratricopeptide (TPR) repeat protein
MKQLESVDPESIMAHSNLSVFYMQQGNKEAAEEEKAIAMSIRMSKMAREMSAQKQEEQSKESKRQEAQERMGMFKQVLEIDPDDLLANSGLGGIHAELEEYDLALPYLLKALEVKPLHTVAYLSLGETYEKMGDVGGAIDTYKQGVAVAAQKGDLMPMKEMQARLLRLGAGSAS